MRIEHTPLTPILVISRHLAAGSVDGVKLHFKPRSRSLSALAVMSATALLAGCASNSFHTDVPEGQEVPVAGEPADVQESPQALEDLPGTTGRIDGVNERAGVKAAARVGLDGEGQADVIAVLDVDSIEFVAASPNKKIASVPADETCMSLSTTATGVAVACDGKVEEYGADGDLLRTINVDGQARSATISETGDALVGKVGSDKVYFYDAEGNQAKDEIVTKSIDQTVLVQPNDGPQRVAVIDRGQTSINDISLADQAYNASLRIGQGVGTVAGGRGNDGVLVASDARLNQMLIYTMNDVVRLHQTTPTAESPWSVLWDSKRQIAWVSTTSDNKLTGYKISSGTPEEVAALDTIANVRGVFDTAEGGMNIVGLDGSSQALSADDLDQAISRGR